MELLFGILIGLFVLVILVSVHELGHAIAARRSGVVVEEFGIGFPPRAWGKKLKNGVLFSLNWLPLGGFVKLQGEHDAADKKGDYGAATFWQKTKILLAGVVMNWVIAALLFTVLAWTGLPKAIENQFSVAGDTTIRSSPLEVTSVVKGSPADKAGLKSGDQIIQFAGRPVAKAADLTKDSETYKGQQVAIVYSRDGKEATATATLRSDNSDHQGYLGVGSGQYEFIHATWSAPIVGVATTGQFTWETLKGLGSLVGNTVGGVIMQFSADQVTREQAQQNLQAAGSSVAGPVGILGTIFPSAERAGLTQLVFLAANISLALAVMNILPIPALDGGRWFVTAIYRIMKKPLSKEREEQIQGTGFMILMLLVIVITIADVTKLFK
ncbi:MAG TPA: M50 family metallopeptidase [Candidatus Saccharimonadales bacterium]|nr:M50 family metallopeptidase [Candidatus Saccharimonadales bacterium]